MKHVQALALLAALSTSAAIAEEQSGDMSEGMGLIERGAMMFFRGLADEIEPDMDKMMEELEPALRGLADNIEPAFRELADMVGEMNMYHPPERMPNGDIILRRKTPLPSDPSGDIEL
ncbi:hypothetical protein [Actibacterium sp. 188UL27-1]|uniref:hypothetical protein n=1 Tax=Actibacterium sp. 188UL27-1 TaxID=2786961 RepID=UPI0019590E04|nr:hypothetical protein [Actibacterium sp. 188UL27-1]MBM7069555.1 hypothetical protein [Actibacterium sp. 188UL27-1]